MTTQGHLSSLVVATKDISPYITSTTVQRAMDTLDNTTYGQTGHTYVGALTDGQITINGLWDKTASVGSYTVFKGMLGVGTPVAFVWCPEGTATGAVKQSGNAIIQTYTESSPVADLITFTATMKISGTVTDGVN